MADSDLVLRNPHTLGSAEAKRRIAGAAAEVKALAVFVRFGL